MSETLSDAGRGGTVLNRTGHACYCEDRKCSCTPEIVAAVERIIDPPRTLTEVLDANPLRNGWTAEAAQFITTPLSYGDALELAEKVMPVVTMPSGEHIRAIDRLAHLLMAVDHARGQSRSDVNETLRSGLFAVAERCDQEGDIVARDMAVNALQAAGVWK